MKTFQEVLDDAFRQVAIQKFCPTIDWSQFLVKPLEPSTCLHDNCPNCKGRGVTNLGHACVHAISCPCNRCRIT